jgi:DNA-binding LacI/PurR family transcriptional regulator
VTDMKQIWSHVPVDGIVAVDASKAVQVELELLSDKAVPLVSVGTYCSQAIDNVQVDLRFGTAQVMDHLIGAGFRRIAHATFVKRNLAYESRRVGYAEAMVAAGLKPEFIHYPLTERQRPVTRRLIQDYLREHGKPEAIFCHSDDVALGIYRGLCDAGVSVPEEIALVGCDGIEDTEYLECPLTTLVQPVAEMCAQAWLLLQQRLEDASKPAQHVMLKPALAIRESSRRRN